MGGVVDVLTTFVPGFSHLLFMPCQGLIFLIYQVPDRGSLLHRRSIATLCLFTGQLLVSLACAALGGYMEARNAGCLKVAREEPQEEGATLPAIVASGYGDP